MKKTLSTLLSVLFCAITFAQSVPQGINYQAVARDASGAVLMNQTLTIQFSVISDITTSAVSWQETHTVNTNDYGLYTAIIGQGTATNVGSSASFDVIDWGASNHLLKVEVDFGSGYLDMGTTAFMSVPYAINSTPQSLTISGDTLFISSGNWIILPSSAPTLLGCTDTTALNFNVLANTDDGTCIINGCTDSTAFNYNPLANSDDGTCIAVVLGCIDSLYTEYDPSANTDDGTCATATVNGCTDTTALNFNVLANTDDGTCIGIGSTYQGGLIFYLDGNGGGLISAPSEIWDPACSPGGGDMYAEWGCLGTNLPGALGLGAGAQNTIDIEAGCTTPCTAADICANYTDGTYSDWFLPSLTELEQMYINLHQQGLGNFFNPIDPFRKYWSSNQGIPMITNPQDDAMFIDFSIGTYSWWYKDAVYKVRPVRAFGSMTVYGCTVISATNYNPLALTDDGSCLPGVNGCTDSTATNYNSLATIDNGSCIINGCTDSTASNYNSNATIDDGSCVPCIWGCTQSTAINYNPLATCNDGSCVAVVNGCTDSIAFNYDANANTDDGSCVSVVNGCTDSTAYSGYDPLANTDDGSCIAVVNGCTDPLYTEYDPLANTNDGSCATLILNGCTDVMITVGGGNYDSEIGWSLVDGSGVTVAAGGAPYSAIACLADDCYTMNMTDSDGDGWNGATYSITDNNSGTVYGTGGLIGSSSSGSDNIIIGGVACPVYGCTDSTATNYDPLADTDDGSCCFNGICVGSTYQGGIIFYILQPADIGYVAGQVHGLIAAPTDQSSGAEWGCYGFAISGADGTAIGTGNQNTIDIINANCTSSNGSPTAADICANLTLGGYSDWFLPSKDELNEMYLNIGQGNVLGLGNIGGFAGTNYWSSTELDNGNAWRQSFISGYENYDDKFYNYDVRAVRAF